MITAKIMWWRGVALLGLMIASTMLATAQRGPQGGPLNFLKRALTEAGAPALTAEQEAKLNELSTAMREARQQAGPDEALLAARKAYDAALLNGDLAGAQAQAAIIASRSAELTSKNLQAEAKYFIEVATLLKSGGQWELLKQKFGEERLVRLLGGPGFGPGRGPGFRPGGSPDGGPGFKPHGARPDNGTAQSR
jgi:hypothetical protein